MTSRRSWLRRETKRMRASRSIRPNTVSTWTNRRAWKGALKERSMGGTLFRGGSLSRIGSSCCGSPSASSAASMQTLKARPPTSGMGT